MQKVSILCVILLICKINYAAVIPSAINEINLVTDEVTIPVEIKKDLNGIENEVKVNDEIHASMIRLDSTTAISDIKEELYSGAIKLRSPTPDTLNKTLEDSYEKFEVKVSDNFVSKKINEIENEDPDELNDEHELSEKSSTIFEAETEKISQATDERKILDDENNLSEKFSNDAKRIRAINYDEEIEPDEQLTNGKNEVSALFNDDVINNDDVVLFDEISDDKKVLEKQQKEVANSAKGIKLSMTLLTLSVAMFLM